MLKMIILSLLLGFLGTWFSSPRFLRQNIMLKGKRIIFRDWSKLKEEPFLKDFPHYAYIPAQRIAFLTTAFCSFILLVFSSRGVSLFSGGILSGFMIAYFFRLVYKPLNDFLPNAIIKKVLFFWKVSFLIYLLLFAVYNIQFRSASVPKYETLESSEMFAKEVFYLSGKDFNAIRNCTIKKVFRVNGKYIVYSGSNCRIFVIENDQAVTIDYPRVGSGATFLTIGSPINLRAKNIKDIGVTVDDEYNPYFVYVSYKQEHFLGKYSVDKFILLNPFDKDNIEYYDELPDFAKP